MGSLKFRVLLDSVSDDEVFRDILIDEKESFETFYQTIIESVGFTGKQLASFYMSNENWDKGEEIGLMDMSFNEGGSAFQTMASTTLQSKIVTNDQKIILVYDFLKMWIFLIELQETLSQSTAQPEVVLSIGKAPKETDKSEDFEIETDSFGEDFDDFDDFDSFNDEDFSDGFEKYDDY